MKFSSYKQVKSKIKQEAFAVAKAQYRLASTRRQPASSLPRSGHWAPNLGPK